MVNKFNYFLGTTIKIVALLSLWINKSFKSDYYKIKENVKSVLPIKVELPVPLQQSIIEIEDKRYFHHLGIDFYSISRAIINNLTNERIEGASTIVQQFVRCITNERDKNIKRKIKEIFLASLINRKFTKEEIFYTYLIKYRFNNCVGIFKFCEIENYNIDCLSIYETAQIAARIKYPSITESNYIRYLKRVRTIEKKIENKNSD